MTELQKGFTIIDESSPQEALVVMKDGDKFVVGYTEAAKACRAAEKMKDFVPQLTEVLKKLGNWAAQRKDQIHSAMLSPGEHGLLFLVMQKDVPFDQQLTDDLTDLDLEIAQNPSFALVRVEVLAIPRVDKETATAFISSPPFHEYAD